MRRFAAVLALLAGCSTPPEAPAPTPADRGPLQDRLKAALDAPYALGRFYAEHEVDNKVTFSCRGTSRGYRSGIVLIEEETPAGAPLRILKVGDRVWTFEEGWKETDGTPLRRLGSGFQSPFEVLAALDAAADAFAPGRQGGMDCRRWNATQFLGPLTDRSKAPPAGSRFEGVLKSGFREGPLVTRFSAENGSSEVWIAKMDIVSWGAAPPMSFDDIPAPFTPEMNAAVQKATERR